jgi:hypothetical protein
MGKTLGHKHSENRKRKILDVLKTANKVKTQTSLSAEQVPIEFTRTYIEESNGKYMRQNMQMVVPFNEIYPSPHTSPSVSLSSIENELYYWM